MRADPFVSGYLRGIRSVTAFDNTTICKYQGYYCQEDVNGKNDIEEQDPLL